MENHLDAQNAVLGAALIEPALVSKVLQEARAEDFTGPAKTVFDAMGRLFVAGTPVDAVSLKAELGEQYQGYLIQLMQITPSAANIDHYLRLNRDRAKVMALRAIGQELAMAEDASQLQSLMDKANGLMVDKSSFRSYTMADCMHSFMERHTGQPKYLSWPISELEKVLYCEAGDFIILGGYPSSGKSALALQCAWHWAEKEKVGFFSLETGQGKLFDRKMSGLADLSMDQLKRNQLSDRDWERICAMTGPVTGRKLEIIPASSMTVADIRSVTAMKGFKIIIVDYVQLLTAEGFNRTEEVTKISMGLHRLAQDMGVTVLGLSQLKRKDHDETPKSSDLRESGQLEQDADLILMLKLQDDDKPDGCRELFVTKNKEGTCPKIVLDFDGKHQTFAKAQRTGDVVQKYQADGKKARRRNAENAQQSFLPVPGDDPECPFGK
jgi:replicative DNA helicase